MSSAPVSQTAPLTADQLRALQAPLKERYRADPATAQQWVESGPFTATTRTELQGVLTRNTRAQK